MICWFVSVVCSCRWLSFSWTVKMSSDSQGSVKGEAPVILSPSSSTSSQGSPLSPSTKPPELPGTTFISLFDLDLDHPPLSLFLSIFLSLSLSSPISLFLCLLLLRPSLCLSLSHPPPPWLSVTVSLHAGSLEYDCVRHMGVELFENLLLLSITFIFLQQISIL